MPRKTSQLTSLDQAKALRSAIRQAAWNLITLLQPVKLAALENYMGLERHALHYHLRILEDCGLVTREKAENGEVTYSTYAEDIFVGPDSDPEWQEVRVEIARAAVRRLGNRIEAGIMNPTPGDAPRKYRLGTMTLFLNEEGRQKLVNLLDQLWIDLEDFQSVPKADEKPYFFAYGFAAESYGHD